MATPRRRVHMQARTCDRKPKQRMFGAPTAQCTSGPSEFLVLLEGIHQRRQLLHTQGAVLVSVGGWEELVQLRLQLLELLGRILFVDLCRDASPDFLVGQLAV